MALYNNCEPDKIYAGLNGSDGIIRNETKISPIQIGCVCECVCARGKSNSLTINNYYYGSHVFHDLGQWPNMSERITITYKHKDQ